MGRRNRRHKRRKSFRGIRGKGVGKLGAPAKAFKGVGGGLKSITKLITELPNLMMLGIAGAIIIEGLRFANKL